MIEALRTQAEVRLNELGALGVLRPTVLLDYLLDAAGNHAARIGVGMHAMNEMGLTWFLSRLHVQVRRYPRGGEIMTIETWPSGIQRLFFTREFVVTDEAGERLAIGSSSWIAVNPSTRRPVRPSSLGVALPRREERPLPSEFPKLPSPEGETMARSYRPLACHIDVNQHVNSTVYPRWTLDCVPEAIWRECLPSELEIAYVSETQYEDTVQATTQVVTDDDDTRTIHVLCREGDGTELLRQRTVWRPAECLLRGEGQAVE
jgi:acyl-ACP thioesterase